MGSGGWIPVKKDEAGWIVIHMAHSATRAEELAHLLAREGFMVKTRVVAGVLSAGDHVIEVLALPSEAKEARDFLMETGQA